LGKGWGGEKANWGQLHERLQKEGVKTHKEKVEELNKYLSNLSEHHDMYVPLPRERAVGDGMEMANDFGDCRPRIGPG
jgi:hypothetical protein